MENTPAPVPPGTAIPTSYPVTLTIDYPDRPLDRFTSFFRIIAVIPIAIVLGALVGTSSNNGTNYATHGHNRGSDIAVTAGVLFISTVLMIVFRQKYPKWWYDWNLQYTRFSARVGSYIGLLRDEYPSTDEEQAIHLNFLYPDVKKDLSRWMPLVKWFLAIPHYVVLFFLALAAAFAIIFAWFAILFTGRYPRSAFDFVVGVQRWGFRVMGYGFLLVTDKYPPFSLD